MAKAETFNVVNNHEDLTELLTTVAPEKTPILSGMPKFRAQTNTLFEWTTDDLDNVSFNGVPEGQDQTTHKDKTDKRERIGNRYQEFRDSYAVSNMQQMSNPSGVSNEEAASKAKSMLQLKLSMEAAIGSDNDLQAGTGLVNSKLRGLGAWVNNGTATLPSSILTPAASIGTTSSLTESSFNDVLQSVYESSGVVQTMNLYAGPTLQRKISDFTRAEGSTTPTPFTVNSNQAEREIVFSVQFYRGDFANVQVISDQFLGRTTDAPADATSKSRGYLLTDEMVNVSVWKAPHIFPQTDEGGGPRGFAGSVASLVVKNPKGLGKFA
jgi:hypothetical protein